MYQIDSMPFPIKIDLSRDSLFDKAGLFKFKKDYLNTSLNETSPQHRYAYVASVFGSDQDHAQRLYEYLSKHWLSAATPILQYDAVDKSGLPASCFLSFTEDTKEGLLHNLIETACMSMSGGGIGHIADTRSADGKSTGKMPHIKVANSMVDAYKQKKRRGAFASYCNIDDNEIEQFIELRNPSRKSASDSERAFNLHHAVNITDEFIEAVLEKKDIWLKCRKTGNKTKQINAYELLMRVIEARALHGEPYIHFIDNSNKRLPEYQKKAGLKVAQSNLCCCAGDMIADTEDGDFPVKDLVGKGAKYWDPDSQTYITPKVDMQLIALSQPIYEITALDKNSKEHKIKVTADHKHSIMHVNENGDWPWVLDEENGTRDLYLPLVTTLEMIDLLEKLKKQDVPLLIESSLANGLLTVTDDNSKKCEINKSYNRVISIELLDQKEDVYCLNMGTERSVWSCNGFVTGNSEIILPTNKDRTAVCFLSSFNLNYFDDWKKDDYIIKDAVEMIDNAITVFIDTLQREYDLFFQTRDRKYIRGFALEKALFSAKAERAMGLGTMGYHQYLQKKGLSFDSSFQTVGITRSIYKHIKDRADEATHALAVERGACPDAAEYGVMVRNSRVEAIAPNACVLSSTSIQTKEGNQTYSDLFVRQGINEKNIIENDLVGWHEFSSPLKVTNANGDESTSNKVYYSGKQPIVRLELEDGSVIECTKNHRLLTFTNFVQWTQAQTISTAHTLVTKDNLYDCLNKIKGVEAVAKSLKLLTEHNIEVDTTKLDKFNGVSVDLPRFFSICDLNDLIPSRLINRLGKVKKEYSDLIKDYPSADLIEYIKKHPYKAACKEYSELLYGKDIYDLVKNQPNMYSIEFQMSRFGLSEQEALDKINLIKKKTAGNLDSFILRHGEEQGTRLYSEFCDKSAHTQENYQKWYGSDWESKWEYMQERRKVSSTYDGYKERFPNATEEEYRDYTASFGTSLKSYLAKDPINGLETFLKNRRKSNQSKQAMQILDDVRDKVPEEIELIYYDAPEEWLVVDLDKKETASYDLYIPSLNLLIDIHGFMFHAHPSYSGDKNEEYLKYRNFPSFTWNQLKERDDFIKELAEDNGYNYEVVWINKTTYFKNEKQKVVNEILDIIESYSNENSFQKAS
jgi:ribonucleotide reductase alpha subunit